MNLKIIIFAMLVVAGLVFPPISKAKQFDGNELVKLANDYDRNPGSHNSGEFMGYVLGVYDATKGFGFFCIPSGRGITKGQILEIVKKDLRDHPQLWHEPAYTFVIDSLMDQYPCEKKPSR